MFNIQGLCPHGSCLSQTRCRGFTEGHYKLFIAPFTVITVFFLMCKNWCLCMTVIKNWSLL